MLKIVKNFQEMVDFIKNNETCRVNSNAKKLLIGVTSTNADLEFNAISICLVDLRNTINGNYQDHMDVYNFLMHPFLDYGQYVDKLIKAKEIVKDILLDKETIAIYWFPDNKENRILWVVNNNIDLKMANKCEIYPFYFRNENNREEYDAIAMCNEEDLCVIDTHLDRFNWGPIWKAIKLFRKNNDVKTK